MKGTLNKTTQVSLHLHTWLIVWFVRMSSREWRQRSTALPASRSYGSFSFLNLWCTTCISSLGPCRTALSQLFRKFRYWIPHGSVQSRNSYSSIMGIFLEQLTWNIPNLYLLGLLFYKSHYWILDRLKWSFNSFFFLFSLQFSVSLPFLFHTLGNLFNFPFSPSNQCFLSVNMHLIFFHSWNFSFFLPPILISRIQYLLFTRDIFFCWFLLFSAFCFLPVSFFPYLLDNSLSLSFCLSLMFEQ